MEIKPNNWINHMTVLKTRWESFSEGEKKQYNPFIINLFLSMEPSLIETINEVQKYQVPNRDHYNIYLQLLPKKKLFLRWIKPKSKKYNKDIISKIAAFYKEGTRQINQSLECLEEQNIIHILENMGMQSKEIIKSLKQ
jgi:pullulanase/glycogen debranching enzyme